MNVNKTLLKTMFREFWSLNNDVCEGTTVIFLKRIGLSDKEITDWININPTNMNFTESSRVLDDAIDDTKHYFEEDD